MPLQYRTVPADPAAILWSIARCRHCCQAALAVFCIFTLSCAGTIAWAGDDQDDEKSKSENSQGAPLVLTNSSGESPDFSVLEKELGFSSQKKSDTKDQSAPIGPVEKIAKRASSDDSVSGKSQAATIAIDTEGDPKSTANSEADIAAKKISAKDTTKPSEPNSEQRSNRLAWSILEATLQLAPPEGSGESGGSRGSSNEPSGPQANAQSSIQAEAKNEDPDKIPSLDESSRAKRLESSQGPERVPSSGAKPMLEIGQESAKECPGAPDGKPVEEDKRPGDVELEQDDHPFDAPPAKNTVEPRMQRLQVNDFTQRELEIHDRINATLGYYLQHPENVVRRGPWALMHASLPFGVETEVIAGRRKVNAIGWMCYNGVCARQRMFQPTRNGFRTNVGPGVQGHEGQFLAILAQSRVQVDYPIKLGSRNYSIKDLVRYEMVTCRERSELTFKLIGLSYYLEPEQRWRDSRGKPWNLEKLLREELAQPINGAACGGSHRLMAITYALREREKDGYPITGIWTQAEDYVADYVAYTLSLQNPDGSFSTEWFEGRGNKPDVERKVQTTGHMLEWLIYTLPEEQLRSPKILASLEYLLNTVGRNPERNWPIGPRGHALRAMMLFNQRVFDVKQGEYKSYLANQSQYQSRR
jgi:hypothetical protein